MSSNVQRSIFSTEAHSIIGKLQKFKDFQGHLKTQAYSRALKRNNEIQALSGPPGATLSSEQLLLLLEVKYIVLGTFKL